MTQTICARCCDQLWPGATTGESALYSPDRPFELCEPCFFAEEALIDEQGTNNLPDELRRYRENLSPRVSSSRSQT